METFQLGHFTIAFRTVFCLPLAMSHVGAHCDSPRSFGGCRAPPGTHDVRIARLLKVLSSASAFVDTSRPCFPSLSIH